MIVLRITMERCSIGGMKRHWDYRNNFYPASLFFSNKIETFRSKCFQFEFCITFRMLVNIKNGVNVE